jgi:hypothetical protein
MICLRCKDSGWVVTRHKTVGYYAGWLCNICDAPKRIRLSEKIPKWNDLLSAFYEPDFKVIIPDRVQIPTDPAKVTPIGDNLLDEQCPF